GPTGTIRWRTITADSLACVDLQAFFGADHRQSVAYLARAVESPADQPATILLGTDNGAKLWVNGELVHVNRKQRSAVPGNDTVPVKLRKGKNDLLLKVAAGTGPDRCYLTILSDQELRPI